MFKLRRCVWEITLACCFSCRFCGSGAGKAQENELTAAECLRVADELAGLGCRRVSLIGGEVFMRPDWRGIVRHLTGQGVKVNLITNGYLLTPPLLRDIRDCGVESVSVSLDGTAPLHDMLRQPGSFDRALAALSALCESDIPASVITTLNSENSKVLEDMYRLLTAYPIFAWQLQACSPMGNAAREGLDVAFDPAEVIGFVEKHRTSAPFLMGIADNIGYFTPSEGYLRGDPTGPSCFRGCSAGISGIGIDSVGNVRGCESMYDKRFIEGNLREKSLKEIWEAPDAFAYNRKFTPDMLTGRCRNCEMGPVCAGGCRSYNYFTHGKLYEAPRCGRD